MGQETVVVHMDYGSHINFPLRFVKNEGEKSLAGDALAQASVFGVPSDAHITINGDDASVETEIVNGDKIAFCKATGNKANG